MINPVSRMAAAFKDAIYRKMTQQLTCDLTIGMEDNERQAYTENEISEFLTTHHSAICLAASKMYDAYNTDNDLASLGDGSKGCNDWYCEYLYEEVTPPQ